MSSPLGRLLRQQRVIVCCGAGGVGKTSVAAALALAAARLGRQVLVVTIDPSRRLAETLGVARNPPAPQPLPADRCAEAGIRPPGGVHAWMLDPQLVSNQVVRRLAGTEQEAETLLSNKIYANVTSMVAGMQEYTAVEALHSFVHDDTYDLVVLDTPPSRNALHFLEAPGRVARFLDGRVFRFFLPAEDSLLRRAAHRVVNAVMDVAFGEATRVELTQFFALFSTILSRLNRNAEQMRRFFQRQDVSFLVVTSPEREALEEARYFEHRTRDELDLPLGGYILNRSLGSGPPRQLPDEELLARAGLSDEVQARVRQLARREQQRAEQHRQLLDELQTRSPDLFVQPFPYLDEGVTDLPSLLRIIEAAEIEEE